MRNLFVFLLIVVLLIAALAFCDSVGAPPANTPIPTLPLQTPFAQTPFPTLPPVIMPTLPPAAPVVNVEPPIENSEWYIDGWSEDSIVVNMYGREIRFDLAEFRNIQTNVPIVVQCIDPEAKRPDLDFTFPVEQRARFIYKGNLFWHSTDPLVQRFIFLRYGELQ